MIQGYVAALFLSCALPVPAVSFTPDVYTPADLTIFRLLTHLWSNQHRDDLRFIHPVILLIDDDTRLLEEMRDDNLNAFAMSPFVSMDKFQFQGSLARSPIMRGAVHVAWMHAPLREFYELTALADMIAQWGYLVIDISEHPTINHMIKRMGFMRTPFAWRQYTAYRKDG